MTDQESPTGDLSAGLAKQIAAALQELFGDVTSSEVFRTISSDDDRVVLGISSVERAGGFGFGTGEGVDSSGQEGRGGGGGGGGVGSARPVAIAEVTSDGVRVWPVLDYTKLGLAIVGLLVATWKATR